MGVYVLGASCPDAVGLCAHLLLVALLNKTALFTDLPSIRLTQPSFKKGFGHFWVYPLHLTDSSGVQAGTWGSGD